MHQDKINLYINGMHPDSWQMHLTSLAKAALAWQAMGASDLRLLHNFSLGPNDIEQCFGNMT